jgi:hypothetical protein
LFGFCSGDGAKHRDLEPLILDMQYGADGEIQVEKCRVLSVHAPFESGAKTLIDTETHDVQHSHHQVTTKPV